nr:M28 family peptidase [Granulicella sp. dw_53]
MHQVDLDTSQSTVTLTAASQAAAKPTPLHLLEEVTLAPRESLPADLTGALIFLGYGLPTPGQDLHNKIAVFFNNTPAGLSPADRDTFAPRRTKALAQAGALATLSIDNPAATEPTHWPAAYARTVTLTNSPTAAPSTAPIALRISAESAPKLFASTTQAFAPILEAGEHGTPLTPLDLNATLSLHLVTHSKDISSPNILAVLPGSDPTLAPEYVALSAHLDGYGYGTPVFGDKLYNGTLDDAAYVALLIEIAKNQNTLSQKDHPRRSLLFCIFTGEEKGLLGSAYFTTHPTVPVANIVADLNLDQLRPIFPLKILTMEGITDSTLGDTARTVAAKFNIELRPDLEPERNLFRRADNYNFVRIGVPIASFIFGYDRGSKEEIIYRDWYARRYHKPQDDLATPIDWNAAATFNQFYADLAITIANTSDRPSWSQSSSYAPAPKTPIPPGCTTTDGKLEKCH